MSYDGVRFAKDSAAVSPSEGEPQTAWKQLRSHFDSLCPPDPALFRVAAREVADARANAVLEAAQAVQKADRHLRTVVFDLIAFHDEQIATGLVGDDRAAPPPVLKHR